MTPLVSRDLLLLLTDGSESRERPRVCIPAVCWRGPHLDGAMPRKEEEEEEEEEKGKKEKEKEEEEEEGEEEEEEAVAPW